MSAVPDEQDAWMRRLSEASLLPPDDPIRQAVEAEIAPRGGLAQAHWLALLEETERMRLALVDVEVPPGLEARLLEIPGQHRWLGVVLRRRGRVAAAAAVAVLVVSVAIVFWAQRPGHARAMEEVALLAVNDHLDTHTWEVEGEDPHHLARALQAHIPFPVHLPSLGEGFVPVGGRRCTLGSHVVAFTAWRGQGGRVTLLQLRTDDYGLPDGLAPTRIRPTGPSTRARPLDVLFVGERDFTWVVVADSGDDLDRIELAFSRRRGP